MPENTSPVPVAANTPNSPVVSGNIHSEQVDDIALAKHVIKTAPLIQAAEDNISLSAARTTGENTRGSKKSMFQASLIAAGLILTGIIIIAYVINSSAGHPEWIWADCLGRAFGTGILAFLSALIIAGLVRLLTEPSERRTITELTQFFARTLTVGGIAWLLYASYDAKKAASEGHNLRHSRLKHKEYLELGVQANPVISTVRFEKENSIKSLLKNKNREFQKQTQRCERVLRQKF